MGVAVVLDFDPINETAILQLRQMLRKNGVLLNRAGEVRPHLAFYPIKYLGTFRLTGSDQQV